MLHKSNKLFVVRLTKVIEVSDNERLQGLRFRNRSKFYVAELVKVGKNCCIYKLLTKNILVVDNNKLVNRVGEYYINYKEALNLATGMFKKEFYTDEEITTAESTINKERENVK